MRWKGIIFLVAFIAILYILSLIFTNRLIENKIEDVGSSIVGAKVEIDDLDFSLTGLHIRWTKLQVTDPGNTMENMLETGETDFDFEFIPFLSGKVIVENIKLTGVQTGTDRETDGRIPDSEKITSEDSFIGKTVKSLEEEVASNTIDRITSVKQNVNVDSILKFLEIESIDKMDNLKTDLASKYDTWETKIKQIDIEQDARNIEQKIKSLDVNKAKTINGFQSTMSDIDQINNTIKSIDKTVSELRGDLSSDLKTVAQNLDNVDDWISEDYNRAMAKAKLPELTAENIGKIIFGKKLVNQVNQYLSYVGMARYYSDQFSSDKPEKQDPPRLEGQTIHFSGQNVQPDFWIKNIELSGQSADELKLAGTANHIVSDQKLIGKTTEFKIGGGKKNKISMNLLGSLNYLEEIPGESIELSYSGFSLAGTQLSDSKFLPDKVARGIGTLKGKLNLKGDTIDGNIKFLGKQLQFDRKPDSKPANKFEGIVHSIVSEISAIDFTARIHGKQDNLKFSLDSNLDEIFADRMKNLVGKEIKIAKEKIKKEIDSKINTHRAELNNYVSSKENYFNNEIKKYEDLVNKEKKLIDDKKKEVEKIFEKEKSNIKDKVKDLFKF